ncbi:MAG: ATP-binding protein [Proteobacteria bacterium]|nr:ATP-binding protein [Pseudomonadota bacterium]
MSERTPGDEKRSPHIGAFVLETLTLGMYGDPRHTLREYVQNAYDSIRAAQRTKFLNDRGRVDVTIASDAITIRDNGLGVRADLAWVTLTSIGASRKDRARDAGFRGIGRLAGMAYCEELTFRTTFPGETTLSTVRFDCNKLLAAMSPDEGGETELATLLSSAVTIEQQEGGATSDEHFFEVHLNGLARAPEALTNPVEVGAYLSETVPVGFSSEWTRREEIEADYRSYFGVPLETVDVYVSANDTTTQLFKPYGDTYQQQKGIAQLQSVEFHRGEDQRYWGWVGYLSESGAVTDWKTRGLRVRTRNIQVDGTQVFESMFTDVKPSYGRFSTYFVGEIHIDPEKVIPNARRDGFEENEAWLSIKRSLIAQICEPLAKHAYQASQDQQADVDKVIAEIDRLVDRSHSIADNSKSTYDQVVDLMNTAKRLRRKASSALKSVSDLDDTAVDQGASRTDLHASKLQDAAKNVEGVETQARMLIGRFLEEDERLAALKKRIREELIAELLEIVNAFVDAGTYQRIKRQLVKNTQG